MKFTSYTRCISMLPWLLRGHTRNTKLPDWSAFVFQEWKARYAPGTMNSNLKNLLCMPLKGARPGQLHGSLHCAKHCLIGELIPRTKSDCQEIHFQCFPSERSGSHPPVLTGSYDRANNPTPRAHHPNLAMEPDVELWGVMYTAAVYMDKERGWTLSASCSGTRTKLRWGSVCQDGLSLCVSTMNTDFIAHLSHYWGSPTQQPCLEELPSSILNTSRSKN